MEGREEEAEFEDGMLMVVCYMTEGNDQIERRGVGKLHRDITKENLPI